MPIHVPIISIAANRPFLMRLMGYCIVFLILEWHVAAQDSVVTIGQKTVTLTEVVVHSNLNVAAFIKRIEDDTSFYKAFRNLKVLGFSALNDVQMMDKKGKLSATLHSRTQQLHANGCRTMQVLEESVTGDMRNKAGEWNYYTMEMYAGLMFAKGTVCGENNIVAGIAWKVGQKSGMEKHKEQLKMLFFNPGKKIPGIPLIGNKMALFDPEVAARYDFLIDVETYQGKTAYSFLVVPRKDLPGSDKNDIVINAMKTWFDAGTLEMMGRTYDLSYDAGVYDFDVQMEVVLTHFGQYLVPSLIRYHGNWYAFLKKRERGVFTATLFDFRD